LNARLVDAARIPSIRAIGGNRIFRTLTPFQRVRSVGAIRTASTDTSVARSVAAAAAADGRAGRALRAEE
jgi:hypothetical protein